VEIQSAQMVTLVVGLYCVGFIIPIGVAAGGREYKRLKLGGGHVYFCSSDQTVIVV
jgi:hypothetical protein